MPGVFVTATGTEIGKTFVTAGLLRAGRRAGLEMDALKPVLTGFRDDEAASGDAGILLGALGRPVTPETIAAMSPWRYAAPLAPSMAAALEGQTLDFKAVVEACTAKARRAPLTLIEGIGGVMVPLDLEHTVLDLIVAVRDPVVLVSGTALGALSHALTAYAVLADRGVAPDLIVLNESEGSTVPLSDTEATLAGFCPKSEIVVLTRNAPDAAFDRLLSNFDRWTSRSLDPSRGPRTAP